MQNQRDFVSIVQRKVAIGAVGPSAFRGQGPSGMLRATHDYLGGIDLHGFAVKRRALFNARLDTATRELLSRYPKNGKSWGVARKSINLFLRDALYNHYLRARFRLERCEALLEVPMDSVVARELRREAGRGLLPPWPGLKRLTPEVNAAYQEFASLLAEEKGLARVHLDAFLWVEGRGQQRPRSI